MAFQNSKHFLRFCLTMRCEKHSALFFHVLAVRERPCCWRFCQNGTEQFAEIPCRVQLLER